MTFIPFPGALFYLKIKPRSHYVVEREGFMDTKVKKLTEEDGSFREDIFRCVAKDDTMVIAKRLTGYENEKKMIFRQENYIFEPVGPAVAAAMEFELGTQENELQKPLDGAGS